MWAMFVTVTNIIAQGLSNLCRDAVTSRDGVKTTP